MRSTKFTILFVTLLCSATIVTAQLASTEVKYRRSSLHTLMLEDPTMPKSDVITAAYKNSPIPEKFNDHTLSVRSFDPTSYKITDEERAAAGTSKQSKLGGLTKKAGSQATGGLVDATDTKDIPLQIDKFMTTNGIARDMVAKWFNRSSKGTFNMNLIGERGFYDASALDINKAKSSARGLATLADAGEELINNTFVIVTRFNYISKEELAAAAKKATGLVSGRLGAVGTVANTAANVAAKGYVVQSTTYLYKLVWNDSVQAVFYQDFWMDDSNFDLTKKEAFDKTNLFTLQFIGDEKAWADVQSSVFSKKSDDELIARATEKSVDAVIAKLQREYEVFRTKTPLFTADPVITAKIGMKEGLEPGDKYEVLEQTLDEKTGRTKYVKKGKIKVDKLIWDNRMTPEEAAADTSKVKLDRTTFDGGTGFYPGMLIRQKS